MAREKTKVRYQPHPATPPDGMEFADVKRTVGDAKNSVIRVLVPKSNGEGVGAAVKYMSSILPADGGDGMVFCAEAIRNAIVNSQVAQGSDKEVEKVGTIVPRIAALRVVDKGAVAGARLQDFIAANGRPPSQAEYKDIYAGLSL